MLDMLPDVNTKDPVRASQRDHRPVIAGIRESGAGIREPGVGRREPGVGRRESGTARQSLGAGEDEQRVQVLRQHLEEWQETVAAAAVDGS